MSVLLHLVLMLLLCHLCNYYYFHCEIFFIFSQSCSGIVPKVLASLIKNPNELRHEITGFLPMRKQRRRSAVQ